MNIQEKVFALLNESWIVTKEVNGIDPASLKEIIVQQGDKILKIRPMDSQIMLDVKRGTNIFHVLIDAKKKKDLRLKKNEMIDYAVTLKNNQDSSGYDTNVKWKGK